jgi:hypothetical protein
MRAKLITILTLFSCFFLWACDKDPPEPETPATAERPPPPTATVQTETSVTVPGSESTTGGIKFPALEVRTWTDQGLVLVRPGDRLTVRKDGQLMLFLYPALNPADTGRVVVRGPFVKDSRGGDMVLVFKGDRAATGHQDVVVSAHGVDYSLQLEVTEPPKKAN